MLHTVVCLHARWCPGLDHLGWFLVSSFLFHIQTGITFQSILMSLTLLQVVYQTGFKFPKSRTGGLGWAGWESTENTDSMLYLIPSFFKALNYIKLYIVAIVVSQFMFDFRRQMMTRHWGETWSALTRIAGRKKARECPSQTVRHLRLCGEAAKTSDHQFGEHPHPQTTHTSTE